MGVLASSPSETVTVIAMALTALRYGGFGNAITPITADLFGSKHVTENYGVMRAAFGFAGLVEPQAAVRLSHDGDYSGAFMMACVLSVIAFLCGIGPSRPPRHKERRLTPRNRWRKNGKVAACHLETG